MDKTGAMAPLGIPYQDLFPPIAKFGKAKPL